MAITLPTTDEFYNFWGTEADDIDTDRAAELITLATNLFWLATGLNDDPTDPRLASLVKYAIMDMAIYIYVQRDDIDELYSSNVSERIGTYSYSKVYGHVSRAVVTNETTGVPLFDKVVTEIMDELAYGDGLVVAGEQVFYPNYVPLPEEVAWSQWRGGNIRGDLPLFYPGR